ncbi:MAG: hypothetical protein ACK57B_05390 [Betaproteobacteria bacterium]
MKLNTLQLTDPTAPTAMGRGAADSVDSQALVSQLGSEVAAHLSKALERVTTLAATGKIDRAGLRALRDEIDRARRAGIMGQQVARLSGGRMQLANERVDLTALLGEALRQRGREIDARGIEVCQVLSPAEVMGDGTLLYSLLQTLLDWCFEHAFGRIDLTVEIKSWPAHACLSASFQHQPPDEVDPSLSPAGPHHEARLSTMAWRLLQKSADVLGLDLQRQDTPGRTKLSLQFPQTVAPSLVAPAGAADPVTRDAPVAVGGSAMAGRHVVVLAARREVRNVVRTSLRPMGLMVDFVTSVEELRQVVADGLPHAVVYEAAVAGEPFERLRREILAEAPAMVFIRISDQGKAFEVLNVGGRQFTSVGRDAIMVALPEALTFELSRADEAAARKA